MMRISGLGKSKVNVAGKWHKTAQTPQMDYDYWQDEDQQQFQMQTDDEDKYLQSLNQQLLQARIPNGVQIKRNAVGEFVVVSSEPSELTSEHLQMLNQLVEGANAKYMGMDDEPGTGFASDDPNYDPYTDEPVRSMYD